MMDTKPNGHNHFQRPPHQGQYTSAPSNPNHAGETNYPLLSHHYTPTNSSGYAGGNYGNYGMSYDPLAPPQGGGAGQSGILNGERNGESS